jgi:hypothetical protein
MLLKVEIQPDPCSYIFISAQTRSSVIKISSILLGTNGPLLSLMKMCPKERFSCGNRLKK